MTCWIEYCNDSILIESSFTFVRSNEGRVRGRCQGTWTRTKTHVRVRLSVLWSSSKTLWRYNRRRWTRKPNVQTALSRPCLVEQTDTEQKPGTADRNRTGFSGNSQQNETRTRYGEVCADVWVKARVISSLHVV